jgi:lipopolysaccharide export system protein LptA
LRTAFLFIFISCSIDAPVCTAQAPIVLERADLLRTGGTTQSPIRYLDGDVWITQDTLSITCEHATYEEALGRLFFEDDVHFVEPTRKIWSDKATYYEHSGRAVAEGNVRIDQDSILIFCDRVIYSEAREEAQFFGDVEIHSLLENALLTGNHGAYNRPDGRGVMTQNPRLVRRFDETDSLVVVGLVIEYLFDQKYAIVTDSVQISRGEFRGWGQKLHYWDGAERARLTGDPILEHGRDILAADSVDAYFEDQKLKRAVLTGRAVATSPVDSLASEPLNTMSGRRMEITFADSQLDSIFVRGNATSVYYIREEGEKKGANRVSGDLIDMMISEGRVSWIYVEGGTEGVYYPWHLEQRISEDDDNLDRVR